MNFSMNYRKRVPMGIIHTAQVKDNAGFMPLQVSRVPVVKSVVKVVESRITKPIKKDESYEVRENMRNTKKQIIIYRVGEEEENEEKHEEKHEEENIPMPVLEEPVIETLSVGVVSFSSTPIIEEQSKDEDADEGAIEDVQQLHEVKKKNRRMKGVRK